MAKARPKDPVDPIDKYLTPPAEVAAAATPAKAAKAPDELKKVKEDSPRLLRQIALAKPFDPKELKWKPGMVKANRCLAMCYIDARLVQDRLDDVCGVDGWADEYILLDGGSVMCKLSIFVFNGSGQVLQVSKCDVGSPSEQPDKGDRLKAAFSDALKRAAVKFGIGRYLYRLPPQWVDYDPVKKRVANPPKLPDFAIPKATGPEDRPGYVAPDEEGLHDHDEAEPAWKGDKLPERPAEKPAEPKVAAAASKKTEAPKGVKEKEAVQDSAFWVSFWRTKLTQCDTPDDLNKILPSLVEVPQEFKQIVWDFIKSEVTEPPVNWQYNASAKKFFGPPGAAIPF